MCMDYDCGEISHPGNLGLYHRTHDTAVLAMVGRDGDGTESGRPGTARCRMTTGRG